MPPQPLSCRTRLLPVLAIVALATWLSPASVHANNPPVGSDKTITLEEDSTHRFTPSDFGFSDPLDAPSQSFRRILIATRPTAGMLVIDGESLVEGEYVSMVPEPRMIWTPAAKSQSWTDIAVSASGDRMAAVWGGESPLGAPVGEVVLSADGGATWTPALSGKSWNSLAMSPDGATLLAAPLGDRLSLSRDFGQTWSEVGPSLEWQSVAISADGTHLLAAPQDGTLRISRDGGTTWSNTMFGFEWSEVAVSPDGSFMVAGGPLTLWMSTDFGITWTQRPGPIASQSVVISGDGTSLLLVSFGGLYYSADRGQSWELRGPSDNWGQLAASADLSRVVASYGPFARLSVSSDGGRTWTPKEKPNRWTAVASSSDGSILAAAVNSGQLRISRDSVPELLYVPAANAHGVPYANFTFRVGDAGPPGSDMAVAPNTFTFNILPLNDPPRVASPIPDQTARERAAFAYTVFGGAFVDPDEGTVLSYEATLAGGAPLPSWLQFNPSTRQFSGTPGSHDTGVIEITVTATDPSSQRLSASDTFRLTVENVDDPPSGTSQSISLVEDTPWTFSPADFGFSDPLDIPPGALGRVKLASLPETGTLSIDGLPAAVGDFARIAPSVPAAVWSKRGSSRNWWAAACSADGTQIAAVHFGGRIFVSPDAGETWTARESNRNWYSIASSADGRHLAAVVQAGQIFTSADAGATWIPRDFSNGWRAIASSADGSRLAAIVSPGQIHTSADFGATWTRRETSRNWYSIASSADGLKLCAVVQNGTIFTSEDAGESWIPRETVRNWRTITSSADGLKLAAIVEGGQIHTSGDGGLTWTDREGVRDWYSIASSADGNRLIAAVRDGRLFHSVNAGVTWKERGAKAFWRAVASSADGERLVAIVPGEPIQTSSVVPAQSLVFTPAPNGIGSPYASFAFQVEDDGAAAASLDPTPHTLTLRVNEANDAPTIDPITDPPLIPAEAGPQALALTGIGAGGGESQALLITAVSGNPALLPHPVVEYTSPASQGLLRYSPAPGAAGRIVVTVTVRDSGGTANGGIDATTRQFTVSLTTPFQRWAETNGLPTDPAAQAGENFLAYAFGSATDGSQRAPVSASGGVLLRPGTPALVPDGPGAGPPFSVLYSRRTGSGLEFQVQFSSDLADWEPALAPPAPAGQDAVAEAFLVPFPAQLSSGRVPRFFRIRIIGP